MVNFSLYNNIQGVILSTSWFCLGFSFIFNFYWIFSLLLQRYFYNFRSKNVVDWKIQPEKKSSLNENLTNWFPILEFFGWKRKQGRCSNHAFFASLNLLMASSFAGAVACASWNRKTRLVFSVEDAGGFFSVILWTFIAIVWQSVAEYYWHRLMHVRWFYKNFHRHHHFYSSPEPFDDLHIHPFEAFGYYCILYSPPFMMPIHIFGFLFYMSLMGICGVVDHGGIRFSLRGLYDSADHDAHHAHVRVNYGFPFSFMDKLHGTYLSP